MHASLHSCQPPCGGLGINYVAIYCFFVMRDDDSLQLAKIAAFGHVVETRPACMHACSLAWACTRES